jgi:hypothetical protein
VLGNRGGNSAAAVGKSWRGEEEDLQTQSHSVSRRRPPMSYKEALSFAPEAKNSTLAEKLVDLHSDSVGLADTNQQLRKVQGVVESVSGQIGNLAEHCALVAAHLAVKEDQAPVHKMVTSNDSAKATGSVVCRRLPSSKPTRQSRPQLLHKIAMAFGFR